MEQNTNQQHAHIYTYKHTLTQCNRNRMDGGGGGGGHPNKPMDESRKIKPLEAQQRSRIQCLSVFVFSCVLVFRYVS